MDALSGSAIQPSIEASGFCPLTGASMDGAYTSPSGSLLPGVMLKGMAPGYSQATRRNCGPGWVAL